MLQALITSIGAIIAGFLLHLLFDKISSAPIIVAHDEASLADTEHRAALNAADYQHQCELAEWQKQFETETGKYTYPDGTVHDEPRRVSTIVGSWHSLYAPGSLHSFVNDQGLFYLQQQQALLQQQQGPGLTQEQLAAQQNMSQSQRQQLYSALLGNAHPPEQS